PTQGERGIVVRRQRAVPRNYAPCHLRAGAFIYLEDQHHFRIVTLPWSRDLEDAVERIGNFLSSYRQ
ncbi:hypothetical protein ACWDNR_12185, partial [Gordonia aichiensis]